jgi:hypothetical protein
MLLSFSSGSSSCSERPSTSRHLRKSNVSSSSLRIGTSTRTCQTGLPLASKRTSLCAGGCRARRRSCLRACGLSELALSSGGGRGGREGFWDISTPCRRGRTASANVNDAPGLQCDSVHVSCGVAHTLRYTGAVLRWAGGARVEPESARQVQPKVGECPYYAGHCTCADAVGKPARLCGRLQRQRRDRAARAAERRGNAAALGGTSAGT